MNFEIQQRRLNQVVRDSLDALIVLWPEAAARADDPVSRLVAAARKNGHFEDKAGEVLASYGLEAVRAAQLVVVHVAKAGPVQVRKALDTAWAKLNSAGLKTVGVHLPEGLQADALIAAQSALADASYRYTTTLSKAKARSLVRVRFSSDHAVASLKKALLQGQALVEGVEMAKEWANRPANHATPTLLAQAAKTLAKAPGIQCEVLGLKEVTRLGMGSFMAVAQGSAQPLKFIVLKYNGAARSEAPVVLVGKGITFDTGGISIKPAPEMDEMKFDMSGAASVLGVFRSLATLKPKVNVVGLIPAAENMPDGQAIKPGDVVTSMSGQTIEILNTDAEGRLILCDALTYAERFKPRAVIDIATLTGACVIALGAVRSGMFSSHDDLAKQLQEAGERSGDLCWRMPLDEDYAQGLKSRFADVANVAGRQAGAVTAAKFLQRFAEKYPWAHLDIAGTAWKSGAAKGATGRPVGLLLAYLLGQ
jgi:leucyl aminopeptidase